MRTTLCRPSELGVDDLAMWRQIQRTSAELTSPFLSPGFALALETVREDVWVAVIADGARTAGYFPFQRRRRVGRGLAMGVSDCQAIITHPEFRFDTAALLRSCGLEVWEVDHLIGGQSWMLKGKVATRSSWTMDLSAGFESYLAGISEAAPGTMRSMLRKRRKFEREHAVTFQFDDHDRAPLEMLRRWKSEQYRRTGRRDRFAWRWFADLVDVLADQGTENCHGRLSTLWAGDELAAAHFGVVSETALACWFPAYDRNFSRYSPGFDLFLRMAEASGRTSLQRMDLGKGDEPFKQVLSNTVMTVQEGAMATSSIFSSLKRLQRYPAGAVERQVLAHPQLRWTARATLNALGRLRRSP